MKVSFSYLDRQFADLDAYLNDIRQCVVKGKLTLAAPLAEFEQRIAAIAGTQHAVGVGTGTDAITMALKMLGVGAGDEVITTPTTFIATVGAIVQTGARPVFVDSEDGFVIDPSKIEAAITPRTKAIVPVHYSGNAADMPAICEIARRRKLLVVEDACQALGAAVDGRPVGSWGEAGAFSLHPLKNLNVWGDGGMIVTHSDELAAKLRLFRNHGLVGRDEVLTFGCNCRLDTLQAVVGNRLVREFDSVTERRIANAARYDAAFADLAPQVEAPRRRTGVRHVYHLYIIRVTQRDALLGYLRDRGVEAKIHYPIPVHLQKAAAALGYKKGDFPVSEADAGKILTLPAHQHLTNQEIEYVVAAVRGFYAHSSARATSWS